MIGDRSTFPLPGMARALSQSYLFRCTEQAEAAAALCARGSWLSAMTVARSLLETIAAYRHQALKLADVVQTGDLQAIDGVLQAATFPTRHPELLARADDLAVQATNILTQIDALRAHRPSVRQDYDFLSEFAHPNALGNFLFFGKHTEAGDTVLFRPDGWIADESVKWVGAACYTLHAALEAADLMEGLAQNIFNRRPVRPTD